MLWAATISFHVVSRGHLTVKTVQDRDPVGLTLLKLDWFFIENCAVREGAQFRRYASVLVKQMCLYVIHECCNSTLLPVPYRTVIALVGELSYDVYDVISLCLSF